MNFYDVLNNHKSIRKYKSDKISEEKLEKILGAGLRASSSGNMQTYSVIVTESEELKQKLYEPHFKQNMVIDAPYLVTFCADFRRMRHWLKDSDAPVHFDNFMSFMIATIDAVLASQNVALAAEAEGLGICYMGTTLASCDEIGKILKSLELSKSISSNKTVNFRILAQIASAVPKRVKFESIEYNGTDLMIISGSAYSDQDILKLISNLNNKKLISQASLATMTLPQNQQG